MFFLNLHLIYALLSGPCSSGGGWLMCLRLHVAFRPLQQWRWLADVPASTCCFSRPLQHLLDVVTLPPQRYPFIHPTVSTAPTPSATAGAAAAHDAAAASIVTMADHVRVTINSFSGQRPVSPGQQQPPNPPQQQQQQEEQQQQQQQEEHTPASTAAEYDAEYPSVLGGSSGSASSSTAGTSSKSKSSTAGTSSKSKSSKLKSKSKSTSKSKSKSKSSKASKDAAETATPPAITTATVTPPAITTITATLPAITTTTATLAGVDGLDGSDGGGVSSGPLVATAHTDTTASFGTSDKAHTDTTASFGTSAKAAQFEIRPDDALGSTDDPTTASTGCASGRASRHNAACWDKKPARMAEDPSPLPYNLAGVDQAEDPSLLPYNLAGVDQAEDPSLLSYNLAGVDQAGDPSPLSYNLAVVDQAEDSPPLSYNLASEGHALQSKAPGFGLWITLYASKWCTIWIRHVFCAQHIWYIWWQGPN